MVKALAWALAKLSGNKDHFKTEIGPGKGWWIHFKRHHTKITLRRCDEPNGLASSIYNVLDRLCQVWYVAAQLFRFQSNAVSRKYVYREALVQLSK